MNEGVNKSAEDKKLTAQEIYDSVGNLSEEEINENLSSKRIGFGDILSKKGTKEIVSRAEKNAVFTVSEEIVKKWGEDAKKEIGREDVQFIIGK